MSDFLGPPELAHGTDAPDFTVAGVGGGPIRLSSFRGRVAVLDFWATWCGPCLEALPHLEELARERHKDLVVLAVNDWDGPTALAERLAEHGGYGAIRFALDGAEPGQDVASRLYQAIVLPTQYVIDRSGRVVRGIFGYGPPTADELQGALAASSDGSALRDTARSTAPTRNESGEHDER